MVFEVDGKVFADLGLVELYDDGVEVEEDSVEGVLATIGVDFAACPGLMTVKKMMTKTIARINNTIPTMIPITRGLLVVQRAASLTESGT